MRDIQVQSTIGQLFSGFPSQEIYTVKDVLLWGLCSEHFKIARNPENSPSQRAVHGLLAAMEVLPLLGQLVSLIEYVFAKFLICSKLGAALTGSNAFIDTTNFDHSYQRIKEQHEKACKSEAVDFAFCAKEFRAMQEIFNSCAQQKKLTDHMKFALEDVQHKIERMNDAAVEYSIKNGLKLPALAKDFAAPPNKTFSVVLYGESLIYQQPDYTQLLPLALKMQDFFVQQDLPAKVGLVLKAQQVNQEVFASQIVLSSPPDYQHVLGYEKDFAAIVKEAGYAGWGYFHEAAGSPYQRINFYYPKAPNQDVSV